MSQEYDYHFIGTGGIGMSALAQVLLQWGMTVSGSDAKESETLERLRALGARVVVGHDAELVNTAARVVVSSAIPESNPELVRAQELGLPVVHRGQLLARFVNEGRGLVAAGSHGKTTITAMLTVVFLEAGADPTAFVGGEVRALGTNARAGAGDHVIAEADESDGSFLELRPKLAIVSNVEDDHLVNYDGSREKLVKAFAEFVGHVSSDGRLILCADDPTARSLGSGQATPQISYGLRTEPVDGALRHYGLEGPIEKEAAYGQRFVVSVSGQTGQPDHLHAYNGLEVRLRVPGAHNVQNALSVVAAAAEEGLAPGAVAAGLSEFEGAARRFHVVGAADGVTVVDDYAHHPTEIAATLAAARTVATGRVIAVFQPHLYSRTQQLAEDFAHSLVEADICVVLPIYGAREEPLDGVTSELIAEPLRRAKNNGVELVRTRHEAVEVVRENAQCGDLVLLMGAGDVNQLAPVLLQRC